MASDNHLLSRALKNHDVGDQFYPMPMPTIELPHSNMDGGFLRDPAKSGRCDDLVKCAMASGASFSLEIQNISALLVLLSLRLRHQQRRHFRNVEADKLIQGRVEDDEAHAMSRIHHSSYIGLWPFAVTSGSWTSFSGGQF